VTFRFRPRYRGVAWTSIGIGGSLSAIATVVGLVTVPMVAGSLGVILGAAYLTSSTWRLRVITDETGFEVGSPKRCRFRLAWTDVTKVVVSPTTNTCFIDGGAAARSLLVPGVGAPAPYDIENRAGLIAVILARVAPEKVHTVSTLESLESVRG